MSLGIQHYKAQQNEELLPKNSTYNNIHHRFTIASAVYHLGSSVGMCVCVWGEGILLHSVYKPVFCHSKRMVTDSKRSLPKDVMPRDTSVHNE